MKSAKPPAQPAETPWENPLIPNKRLRGLYTAMAELRLLQQHTNRRKFKSGDEACRVSTALSLLPGDLTSDPTPGPATAFLRGAKLSGLTETTGQLPVTKDAATRLHIAIGAALALGRKKGPLVLAYVDPATLTLSAWKPLLRLAATPAAPILLVMLPAASKNPGQLSLVATTCGVPGIPVDAADAVALYRVAQESMLRIRSGGGPVLMECIPFEIPGAKTAAADPILNMRESLIRRNLADDAWFASTEARFAARLKTLI